MSDSSELIAQQILNASINKRTWGTLVYNAKAFGAIGDGVTDDTAAIQDAIEIADTNGGVVAFAPGTYVTNSFAVPSNVTLWISDGANLNINSGSTVTINGFIDAGLYQIFSGLGAVTGISKNDIVYPQWWGAKEDGIQDDTTYIQKAINSIAGSFGSVYLKKVTLYSLGSLTIPSGIILVDDGWIIDFNAKSTNSSLYIRRNANFTGGTPGFVNSALYTFTEVRPNVTSYEWGITSVINVEANAGDHVALYGLTRKYSGAGSVWGSTLEVIDESGADTIGSSFIGLEVNMKVNGDNANNNRIGVDIISRTFGAGTRAQLKSGIRLGGDGKYKTGIELLSDMTFGIDIQGTTTVAINTSSTTTNEALRMGQNQAISFENTGSIKMLYNNTTGYIEFFRGGVRRGYIDTNGVDHAL